MFTAPASDKTQYAFHRLFYAQVDSQVNSLSPVQVNSLSPNGPGWSCTSGREKRPKNVGGAVFLSDFTPVGGALSLSLSLTPCDTLVKRGKESICTFQCARNVIDTTVGYTGVFFPSSCLPSFICTERIRNNWKIKHGIFFFFLYINRLGQSMV